MKLKFYARWEDGVFNWKSPEWVKKQLRDLDDCDLVITMEKDYGKRSNQQNRYLHGIVIPLVLEGLQNAGFKEVKDEEDAKLVIKSLFLKKKIINEETGEVITEIIQDTHKLSTVEMVKFIEDVTMWAASYLSVVIPAPGEQAQIFEIQNHN